MPYRHYKYFTLIVLLISLNACRPPVTFDKPQPPNSKELSSFPDRIQGAYLSEDKGAILTVSDKMVIVNFGFEIKIPRDSLGNYTLNGDTLTDRHTSKKMLANIIGDTILANNKGTDTLFNISAKNVLKKFRGYYFLNSFYDKDAWTIQRISLSNGVLALSDISDSTHISQLREIAETPEDTVCTNFKLNQKQFKKFVKADGFDQTQRFTRINGK